MPSEPRPLESVMVLALEHVAQKRLGNEFNGRFRNWFSVE